MVPPILGPVYADAGVRRVESHQLPTFPPREAFRDAMTCLGFPIARRTAVWRACAPAPRTRPSVAAHALRVRVAQQGMGTGGDATRVPAP